jgi:hypothetical protein
MMKRCLTRSVSLLAFFFTLFSGALAQELTQRVEVGAAVSIIDLRSSIGEKTLGVGGRFTYNLADRFALDSEVVRFPQENGYYGYTQALAGVKAGFRYHRLGAFAKFRPGVVHFNGAGFRASNGGSKTNLAVDVGGVLELYSSSRRIAVRIDFGDTIIPFGDEVITRGGGLRVRPGTTHNLQSSFGVSLRL